MDGLMEDRKVYGAHAILPTFIVFLSANAA